MWGDVQTAACDRVGRLPAHPRPPRLYAAVSFFVDLAFTRGIKSLDILTHLSMEVSDNMSVWIPVYSRVGGLCSARVAV
jgi:hypothetical protein